jgi:hypothetical protein
LGTREGLQQALAIIEDLLTEDDEENWTVWFEEVAEWQ